MPCLADYIRRHILRNGRLHSSRCRPISHTYHSPRPMNNALLWLRILSLVDPRLAAPDGPPPKGEAEWNSTCRRFMCGQNDDAATDSWLDCQKENYQHKSADQDLSGVAKTRGETSGADAWQRLRLDEVGKSIALVHEHSQMINGPRNETWQFEHGRGRDDIAEVMFDITPWNFPWPSKKKWRRPRRQR